MDHKSEQSHVLVTSDVEVRDWKFLGVNDSVSFRVFYLKPSTLTVVFGSLVLS